MDLLCRIGRHRRNKDAPLWNNGYWFGNCAHCGCDLIRRGGGPWQKPPRNLRVIWKPRGATQIDWNGLVATRPARAKPSEWTPEKDQLRA